MRKIIISVVLVIVLILAYLTCTNGIASFFKVYSFKDLSNKKEEVNTQIAELTALQKNEYKTEYNALEKTVDEYLEIKENYGDSLIVSSNNHSTDVSLGAPYQIEYLWTILGNHATEVGVDLSMDPEEGTEKSVDDSFIYYNLNFKLVGKYVPITDFILKIENDTNLEFKIKQFKMYDDDGELKATFVVENVPISTDTLSGTNIESFSNQ